VHSIALYFWGFFTGESAAEKAWDTAYVVRHLSAGKDSLYDNCFCLDSVMDDLLALLLFGRCTLLSTDGSRVKEGDVEYSASLAGEPVLDSYCSLIRLADSPSWSIIIRLADGIPVIE